MYTITNKYNQKESRNSKLGTFPLRLIYQTKICACHKNKIEKRQDDKFLSVRFVQSTRRLSIVPPSFLMN